MKSVVALIVLTLGAGALATLATDDGAGSLGAPSQVGVAATSYPRVFPNCPAFEPQITLDLSRYPVITQDLFERGLAPFYSAHAIHYVIKDNVLYAAPPLEGAIVGIRKLIEPFFLQLLKKTKIPDVEFILNMSDYPVGQAVRERGKPPSKDPIPPIISMCAKDGMFDIVMPTYKMTNTAINRGDAGVRALQKFAEMPWEQRKEVLVWRGSDSNRDRFKVNLLASSPEYEASGLFDIGINKMVRIKHDPAVHGPVKDTLNMSQFFSHKWVFNVDGSVAAYRLPYLIAGGSTLLKQESPYYEHFYKELVPWVHYVPVRHDFADLLEKTKWVKEHDAEAKAMGEAARKFALERLNNEMIFCYVDMLLHEYAARMDWSPIVTPDMSVVTV